jgi:hypothetical protein
VQSIITILTSAPHTSGVITGARRSHEKQPEKRSEREWPPPLACLRDEIRLNAHLPADDIATLMAGAIGSSCVCVAQQKAVISNGMGGKIAWVARDCSSQQRGSRSMTDAEAAAPRVITSNAGDMPLRISTCP